MLSKHQIEKFFSRFDIPLEGEKLLSETEVSELIFSANQLGFSFVGFVKNAILNQDCTGTNAFFSSFDDVFDCYCYFMVGFHSDKNNPSS